MTPTTDHETLNRELDDPAVFAEYTEPCNQYRPGFIPRLLGGTLIRMGDLVYGKQPSYLKFRAIEIVARVPYHSWESAIYTLLTLFFRDPQRAMRLSQDAYFSRLAQDNETMHVVVISELSRRHVRAGVLRHTLIPMIFAFFYFWALYWLYFMSRRASYELNFVFESHAMEQYQEFLVRNETKLRHAPVGSNFLCWYGRELRTEYEFFRSVRNDEAIHRSTSMHLIQAL
jgi:ubiquinol oxidase